MFKSEKMKKIKPSGIRELFAKAAGVKGVISLGIGAPDIQTPKGLKEALKTAVDNNHNNYDQTPGNFQLRTAITDKYLKEYNTEYDPKEGVIVTCGGCQLIYTALQAYINPGDEVLVQDPCFLTYPRQVTLSGGKTVWMPSTPTYQIDVEKAKEKITEKTKAIMINFPSNPTGAIMEKNKLQALVDIAVDNDLLIISDEVYEYYLYDNKKHIHVASLNGAYERTITVNSFSKSYCVPGWRMGYGVADPTLMKNILGYHSFVIANAPTPTQIALAEFMHTKEADDFVNFVKKEFEKRRNAIEKGLNSLSGINCPIPQGSFYCYFNIQDTKYNDAEEFSNAAFEKEKVVVVPGTEFGPSGSKDIRGSFGSVNIDQIQEFIERLERVIQ